MLCNETNCLQKNNIKKYSSIVLLTIIKYKKHGIRNIEWPYHFIITDDIKRKITKVVFIQKLVSSVFEKSGKIKGDTCNIHICM